MRTLPEYNTRPRQSWGRVIICIFWHKSETIGYKIPHAPISTNHLDAVHESQEATWPETAQEGEDGPIKPGVGRSWDRGSRGSCRLVGHHLQMGSRYRVGMKRSEEGGAGREWRRQRWQECMSLSRMHGSCKRGGRCMLQLLTQTLYA